MKVHAPNGNTSPTARQALLPIQKTLLANSAGYERVGSAFGAGRAPRQIDFRRADVSGRHVDALSGFKTFSLAHCVGSSHAVGNPIGRQLAFLVPANRTGRRDARDSIGGIFGAFDRRFGGIACRIVKSLDLFTGVLKRRIDGRGLLFEPAGYCREKSIALAGGLRRRCLTLSRGLCSEERKAAHKKEGERARSRRLNSVEVQSSLEAHGRSGTRSGANDALPSYFGSGVKADQWRN